MNDNTSVLSTTAPPTLFIRHHYPSLSVKQTEVTLFKIKTSSWINSSFPLLVSGFHAFLMSLQLPGVAHSWADGCGECACTSMRLQFPHLVWQAKLLSEKPNTKATDFFSSKILFLFWMSQHDCTDDPRCWRRYGSTENCQIYQPIQFLSPWRDG